MPIYEYKCSKCSKEFEEIRKISDCNSPAFCKKCGVLARRQLSIFSIPNSSIPSRKNKKQQEKYSGSCDASSGSCGIRISEHSRGTKIRNCAFRDMKVGVSAHIDAEIEMTGNSFTNVENAVEFRDK